MASADPEIGSSSSTRRRTYDVFLSFRGSDTRNSFADHLCSAMKQKGINVFVDNEKLVKGKDLSLGLLSAIEESEFAVVIISENYVRSKWCMMELAKIMELQRESRLEVLPVFYEVSPSDVRNQRNNFAEAFAKHREDPKIDEEQTKRWRAALTAVSHLAGWDVRDRPESTVVEEICEKIVGGISQNLNISMEQPRIQSFLEKLKPRLVDTGIRLVFTLILVPLFFVFAKFCFLPLAIWFTSDVELGSSQRSPATSFSFNLLSTSPNLSLVTPR